MSDNAHDLPANRFNELPSETQKFLSRLDENDIKLLEEGLVLVRSTLTIGRFMKWLLICFLAIVVGAVSFYDNVVRIIGWFQTPK